MGMSYIIVTISTPDISFKAFISSYLYKKRIKYSLSQQITSAASFLVHKAIVETFRDSFWWDSWAGSENGLFYFKINTPIVQYPVSQNYRLFLCYLWELRLSYCQYLLYFLNIWYWKSITEAILLKVQTREQISCFRLPWHIIFWCLIYHSIPCCNCISDNNPKKLLLGRDV